MRAPETHADPPQEPLLERAEAAVEAAAEIVADSEVFLHLSADLRGKGLMSRCAWCGRYRAGDRWVVIDPSARRLEDRTSHGICENCVVALREAGMSV